MVEYALGMIETKGLVAAIEAADAALKAANVKIVSSEKVKGGIINIKIIGDVAAVRSAVDAGAAAAQRVGTLLGMHVIPRPDEALEHFIFSLPQEKKVSKPKSQKPVKKAEPAEEEIENSDSDTEVIKEIEDILEDAAGEDISDDLSGIDIGQLSMDYSNLNIEDSEYLSELQKLNVHALRKLARDMQGLAIRGRQISMANKEKLIEEMIKARIESRKS